MNAYSIFAPNNTTQFLCGYYHLCSLPFRLLIYSPCLNGSSPAIDLWNQLSTKWIHMFINCISPWWSFSSRTLFCLIFDNHWWLWEAVSHVLCHFHWEFAQTSSLPFRLFPRRDSGGWQCLLSLSGLWVNSTTAAKVKGRYFGDCCILDSNRLEEGIQITTFQQTAKVSIENKNTRKKQDKEDQQNGLFNKYGANNRSYVSLWVVSVYRNCSCIRCCHCNKVKDCAGELVNGERCYSGEERSRAY